MPFTTVRTSIPPARNRQQRAFPGHAWRGAVLFALAVIVSNGLSGAEAPRACSGQIPVRAQIGQILEVESPDAEGVRRDAPASVLLAVDPADLKALRLVELTADGSSPVPSQLAAGDPPALWWIVPGELPAGSRRRFRIERGVGATSSEVRIERTPGALVVRIGDSPVLQYNAAHVEPPPELDSRYGRSGHLHPVWTPGGAIVTDQFPPDHAHQSGVFLAFPRTEFEGRAPDFWNLLGGTGRVRSQGITSAVEGPVFGEFTTVHEHVDLSGPSERVALLETWRVRVWNASSDTNCRVWDVTSTIRCATTAALRLPEFHYGGMALRGARSWDVEHVRFHTSEGKDRHNGNHSRAWWCDMTGLVGDRTAGILMVTHPENFRAPEPLRIHPTMPYMVYTPSFLGDWEIRPAEEHVARYRFVVHDGELSDEDAGRFWRQFAQPLVVRAIEDRN